MNVGSRAAVLLSSWLATGCCWMWAGVEPGACNRPPDAPQVETDPYRVTVRGCSEVPEIFAASGKNDGPPTLSEAEFRQDYQPRTVRVQAHVETPRGTTLGQQGDLHTPYVTFWIRQPRDSSFVAREVHVAPAAFETFTAVGFRCSKNGELR